MMINLNQHEMKVFLAICKRVRREQDLRKNSSLQLGKELRTSPFIHIESTIAWYGLHTEMHIKQYYAILHKLQDKGLIKYHRGNSKRESRISLTKDGVNFVKEIKQRIKK